MKRIVLNTVVSDGRCYGKLFYDESTDQLYFKNSKDKSVPLIGKKIIKIRESKILYQGVWSKDVFYEANELVHDPEDNNRLYICIKTHQSEVNPREDAKYWRLICSGTSQDNILKKYVKEQSTQETQSIFLPSESMPNVKNDVSYVYAMMTNRLCCIKYNEDSGTTEMVDSCQNKHTRSESDSVRDTRRIEVTKGMTLNIPINYVIRREGSFVGYNNEVKNIIINKSGFYKITYNITYYGSISSVVSRVALLNISSDRGGIVQQSVHRSINRVGQLDDDEFYEDINNENDIIQTINHTCYTEVDISKFDDYACRVVLTSTFGDKSIGKSLYLLPIRTWLKVKKIR